MLKMFRRVPMALSAGAIAVALAFDPYLPSTVLEIHGGDNYVIRDEVNNILTNVGVVPGLSFDSSCAFFNGMSYLSLADSPDWYFGSGDVTVESWIYWDGTVNSSGYISLWGQNPVTAANMRASITDATGNIRLSIDSDNNAFDSTIKLPVKAWTHLAFVKSGTTYTFYVNGVSGGSKVSATALPNIAAPYYIGTEEGLANYSHKGFFDSFRITKGVARYTSTFTPTKLVMDSSDPYWNQTVLAINFESGIVDLKGHAVTNTGVVRSVSHPFSQNTSIFSTGSSLSAPYNSKFDWWKSDFTIEAWVHADSWNSWSYVDSDTKPVMINNGSPTNVTNYWGFGPIADGRVSFYYFNGAPVFLYTTATLPVGTWNHIALTVSGTSIKIFINGVLALTSTISGTPQSSTGYPLQVGRLNNQTMVGSVYDLRVTSGVNRYPAAGSVPTSPFLDYRAGDYYWDSTTFLLSGKSVNPERGGAPVSSGGIIVSQAQSKTGDPAIYYDGANRLEFNGAASDFVFPGNFTIEGWVYKSGLVGAAAAGDATLYGVSNGSAHFAVNVASSQISVYLNTGTPAITFNTTTNYMLNAWHHIALSRVGTTVYLLLDGAVVGTATASGQLGYVNTFAIGGLTYSAYHFNGYLQAFRITNGVGRYQASFSNTTLPLPNYVSGLTTDLYWKYISLLLLGDSATPENGAAPVSNWGGSISNSETKTGGGSLYFDGTRRIDLAASTAHVFTGDFTLETWVKKTGIVGARTSTTDASVIGVANGGAWFGINMSSNQITVWLNGSSPIITYTGAANSNMNVWQHIAVVRLDGTVTLYLNGVAVATAASSGTVGWSTSTVSIGGTAPSGNFFNGYIQNVRLSKNVGRYRGNFTPPVYKFPITG